MSDIGTMPDILEVEAVTAGYDRTIVLEEVSVTLPRGAALAVLGRNGVGKTTLMRTIAGHASLQRGRIRLDGTEITRLPAWARTRLGLGLVPQEREIFPSLTVSENITIGGRPGTWTLDRLFELFPLLAERRRNFGSQLSGGEQQMLSIARALALQPAVLLMDEPFEGLAPTIVNTLVEVFQRLRGAGLSIVLVEQHARLALEMTEEAVALVRGRVVLRGASRALLQEPAALERALAVQT